MESNEKQSICQTCRHFTTSGIQFPCGNCLLHDSVVGFDETCDGYVDHKIYTREIDKEVVTFFKFQAWNATEVEEKGEEAKQTIGYSGEYPDVDRIAKKLQEYNLDTLEVVEINETKTRYQII